MALEIKGLFNPTSVSIPTSHLAEIMDGGEEPTDSFTVTKNLSHCAISNEQIGEASYYAEIAPTDGWSDLQVTIKVGGVDMSEYYSSGVISIPNVTGNIVITATAAAAPLVSITATYTQSGTVYDTDSLDSLKPDLVVTANYDNGTSEVVTNYTLSGTLAEGTSTITVTYGGKTTTFDVTVINIFDTPLPEGYTRYDYLQNDRQAAYLNTQLGKEYVNTGYEIGIKFSVPNLADNANSSALYCLRTGTGATNSRALWVKGAIGENNVAYHLANTDSGFVSEISDNTIYEIVTVDKKAYIDGTLEYTAIGNESIPTAGFIPLFGRYDNGGFSRGTTVFKIYSFWAKGLDGQYDAVMIPCTNSNNVAGMYDVIRQNFYDGGQYASYIHAYND